MMPRFELADFELFIYHKIVLDNYPKSILLSLYYNAVYDSMGLLYCTWGYSKPWVRRIIEFHTVLYIPYQRLKDKPGFS